jgi:prolyl oligopeptidase
VDPLHARKMAARLQAATSSGHPVLLRLESKAGHGAGKPVSKLVDELADVWTFVFTELDVQAPSAAAGRSLLAASPFRNRSINA